MLKSLLSIAFICLHISLFAQSPKKAMPKLGKNPLFFLDSISISKLEMLKFKPEKVASLTIIEGKEAVLTLGDTAKDGVVYLESIPFAKKRFHRYFKAKSKEYESLVPNLESDSTVQYILNDKVLEKDYEGNLASIDDKVFEEIKLLSKEDLIKNYGISTKLVGVLIRAKVPKNLDNNEKKF